MTAQGSSTPSSQQQQQSRQMPPSTLEFSQSPQDDTQWSGLETQGMREAKCSLLIQDDGIFDPRIRTLQRQRVLVYQDRGYNNHTGRNHMYNNANGTNDANGNEEDYIVDFNGCTILQLEPTMGTPQRTMPVTLTVGGRCLFTVENYQDFRVMMRTREQSQDMNISPNGNFDWPDINALLLCPLCGSMADIPTDDDHDDHDDHDHDDSSSCTRERKPPKPQYWLLFYPLLQITVMRGSQMTLGTRTICRLTCLHCMDELLDEMYLKVRPASMGGKSPRLSFMLSAREVLDEAGSAAFLEDGPPRPETHPNMNTLLDAWTLYNVWEHSGAWEALQNDYRVVLSRSMQADSAAAAAAAQQPAAANGHANGNAPTTSEAATTTTALSERLGRRCGNPECVKVHGQQTDSGEMTRLSIRCKGCLQEFYCSRTCRDIAKPTHDCPNTETATAATSGGTSSTRQVTCDTCGKRSSYRLMKKCSRCRNATYCSPECQKEDWPRHKNECKKKKRSTSSKESSSGRPGTNASANADN